MSDYQRYLDQIDAQLGNGANTVPNFYENYIKQDLPYFQNQNAQKFQDEMYENSKFRTAPSLGKLNFYTEESLHRKNMENEMEPYIYKMKNELNLMIDNFIKEMDEYLKLKP